MAEAGSRAVPVNRTPFEREMRPGGLIRGDVRLPPGGEVDTAIVVVHGFKGFKDWGFFPHLCDRLAAAGHAVVSFNFSRNGVGEDLLEFTELERFATNTLSFELEEVLGMVDEVAGGDLLPVRPRRLGVLGHSRGGGQTILAAAESDRIDAIATWAAVADFDRWSDSAKSEWRATGRSWVANARTGQQMPLDVTLLDDFEAHRERLDVRSAAARLDAPWLIVHGAADETVVVEEARTLAGQARHGRLVCIDGAGHTFEARHPFDGPPAELTRAIDESILHFAQHLEG